VEAFISTGEGGAGLTALLDPRNFVPMEFWGTYSNGWTLWRLKGQGVQGITGDVEPPQWALDARQKYNDALSAPTEADQIAKMRAVVQEATDRFYQIGAFQGGDSWNPFSARLGNLYDSGYMAWLEGNFKIFYPEQWYIKP
jgi:peptide/nickel transport system substrate-binding protein